MFTSCVHSIIVSSVLIGAVPGDAVNTAELWCIDKPTVFVGGCVTITVNRTTRQARKYTLSIDDRPPVNLLEKIGPTIRRGDRTFILLSHQLFSDEGIQVDGDNPRLVHMVPLFHSLGTVRLTLLSGDDELGTKEVTVIEAPDGAQPAVELIFPTFEPMRRRKAPVFLVMRLLMGADVSNMLKEYDNTIELLREELLVVRSHPDWSEIATMAVADVEATFHYKSTIAACREARDEGRELNTEPPIPDSIAQALERMLNSPYAKAIQDGIRQTIAARQWIPSLIEVPTPVRP